MADWPREIHGHTVAREVDFRRGSGTDQEEIVHVYRCIGCNLQFTGPDDPRLQEQACTRLVRDWR